MYFIKGKIRSCKTAHDCDEAKNLLKSKAKIYIHLHTAHRNAAWGYVGITKDPDRTDSGRQIPQGGETLAKDLTTSNVSRLAEKRC